MAALKKRKPVASTAKSEDLVITPRHISTYGRQREVKVNADLSVHGVKFKPPFTVPTYCVMTVGANKAADKSPA